MSSSVQPEKYAAPKPGKYPIDFPDRPYQEVHESAKKAWQLVEVSYFVVNDKYIHATGDARQSVTSEINEKIFGVNKEVDALFKDAIKQQPDNPLNYAAYAIYLKPRKRLVEKGFVPAYEEALEQIDKAIELWPDESSFYTTKIYIMTAPHQAHEWMRAGALEDVVIAGYMDEVNRLFALAEKYDPENCFINYWHAQLLFRYTPLEELDKVRGRLLAEIKAGNAKPEGYFLFGAPLPPRCQEAKPPILTAQDTEPVYVDQWVQFGSYSGQTIEAMGQALLSKMTWPKDKQDISQIMYMYYNLGRTIPYDRSFFSMQQVVLDKIRHDVEPKSEEAAKLGSAGRFLDSEYQSAANMLYKSHRISDPAKVNVQGISELEKGHSRMTDLKEAIQGRQAAYLQRFGELTGIKFPLPEDSEKW